MIEIETPFFQEAGEPVHQPGLLWHEQLRYPRLPYLGQYQYFSGRKYKKVFYFQFKIYTNKNIYNDKIE